MPEDSQATKGKLIADLAEFICAKIDANEALFRESEANIERSGNRATRAAQTLAQSLEAFVDARIEQRVGK